MSNLPDPVGLLTLIVVFGLAPFAALMVTSYTKLVIVLGPLRAALGIQQIPPNMVLNGIAVILSVYIMAPIGMEAADTLKRQNFSSAIASAWTISPLSSIRSRHHSKFLEAHTKERSADSSSNRPRRFAAGASARLEAGRLDGSRAQLHLTELTKAFQVGFVIYLVFVVVDLIVANILLALGMSMIAPTVISVPFKLLLL
jgi:type III secretion protein R